MEIIPEERSKPKSLADKMIKNNALTPDHHKLSKY